MDFWPGFAMRRRDTENSIGWRRDKFVAVEKHTVRDPLLQRQPAGDAATSSSGSLDTGLEAWFANFHNPADTARYHHQQRFRDRATGVEIALANRLVAHRGPGLHHR